MSEKLPRPEGGQVNRDRAEAILRAAASGGDVSREEVREVFDKYHLGALAIDAAEQAESRVISLVAGSNLLVEESFRSRLSYMRENLAVPGDGELERLLIHRVALTWLALAFAEDQQAGKWQEGIMKADADFWDRHVSHLHTEFLRATKTLAQLRRLTQPTLVAQLNIAEQQQINVVGQAPSEAEHGARRRRRG